ncbi:M48 family metallopeptidase [Planctomycetota bacterium]
MWEVQRKNKRDSFLLICALGTLMILGGVLIGMFVSPDESGAIFGGAVAFAVWAVLTGITLSSGDKIMLGFSRAKKLERQNHPQLFNIVEEMCIASGMPMPRVYMIDDTAPNAFATGRKPETAAIAVTRGLLMKLNRDELQAVVAHEMSHVKNRDILYMIVTGIMIGVIVLIADFTLRGTFYMGRGRVRSRSSGKGGGQAQIIILVLMILFAILAPIVARILFFAISRKREYLADACAAEMTRYPDALADALEKISGDREVLEVANRATSALYICNPIKKFEARAKSILSTHPPINERIKILRAMGRGGDASFMAYNDFYKQLSSYRAKTIIPDSAVKRAPQKVPILDKLENLQQPAKTQGQQLERLRDIRHLIWGIATVGGMIACSCGAEIPSQEFATLKKMHEETTGNAPGVVRCPGCKKPIADPKDKKEIERGTQVLKKDIQKAETEEDSHHARLMQALKGDNPADSKSKRKPSKK